MKSYNSIEYYGQYYDLPIYAMEKIDGSNVRIEFSQKRGFYKFGTRNTMIDSKSTPFGFAIDLFMDKYNKSLTEVFKSKTYRNYLSFVAFVELVGTKSAYGQHDFENDTFDLKLFDISVYKKGLIPPKQFIDDFKDVGIVDVIYQGNLNKSFIQDVKDNKFGLKEGVVCKGLIPNKKEHNLYYCKIKTNEWLENLKNKFPEQFKKEQLEINQFS